MEQISRLFRETVQVVVSLVRPAARSVRENSGLAVLSVVLAFGLWIFVTDTDNPTRTRVLPIDIAVQPVNVPADVAVAEPLASVRARVRVADDVFDSLTAADFEVTVDLDGLAVGVYDLAVEARPLTSRGGLRVEGVLPGQISVTLSPLTTKSVDVLVEAQGGPPPGYTMGAPLPADSTVLVSGPQEEVDKVSQAVAVIDIEGRTESVRQGVRLVARDQRDFLVLGVSLAPAIVDVSIEIRQEQFSRSLAVSPQLSGSVADGYNVVAVSANPSAVSVRGSRAFIEGAVSIPTRPVDIASATDDVVRTVSLDVPSGATVSGGVPVVTVTVKIDPAQGLARFLVPVSAANLGEGLSMQGALPSVEVTLFGPLPILRLLTPDGIPVTVDLKDRGAGTHRLSIKVAPPQNLELRAFSPQEIDVTLEKR
ncbi:MAG: CdaR family protein [Dehalococcoidia bacterium]|nr:CdaR family protein [Dehalococcoidia bacterium]